MPRRLLVLSLLIVTAVALGAQFGWRHGVLWAIALALGATLWSSAFSFAGAYRRALSERRTVGVRAQLLLLAVAVCLFLPALEAGEVFGQPVRGFIFSIGYATLIGAFMFGVGMQLGGGCGSGTLYAAGGGATRPWITLAAFVGGATVAAGVADVWLPWPSLPSVSLLAGLGFWPSLLSSVALLCVVAAAAGWLEVTRHGDLQPLFRWQRTTWSPGLAALALAGLSFATLLVAGRPWGITAAFPLWGSKAIEAIGLGEPAFWTYWDDPTRTEALLRPVLADRTSIMDMGVVAGAFAAALFAGGLPARGYGVPARAVLAAVIGGLLLGSGAVLASGCNISAFLGGIASGSLHGWVWIVPALLGNAVGLRLRPLFRLERTPG